LLYLPQPVFDALSTAIADLPGFQQLFKQGASFFNSFDGCVQLSKAQIDDALPALTMTFGTGNTAFSLDAKASESYLQPEYGSGSTEVWCTGIGTFPGGIPYTVIGGSWLRSHIVIFDRQNNRMGFAPHSPCP
jgi:hypothetical protein